jgi:hypothetical protein
MTSPAVLGAAGDLAAPFGSFTPADVPAFVSCLLSP